MPASPAAAAAPESSLVLAPVSPAPDTFTLKPMGALRPSRACDGLYHCAYDTSYESSISLMQTHDLPRQAKWWGDETRRDTEGRRWVRRIYAVVNDFGDLVEVAP